MTNDTEARKAVRLLMDRFESMKAQSLGLAYVLVERDPGEYSQLLEAARKATAALIQPIIDADARRSQVYAALNDPNGDWSKALLTMLNAETASLDGTRPDQASPGNDSSSPTP